jgi:putative membrane protein
MEDREFVFEAAKDGLTGVELGELGMENAQNEDLKEFARRLAEEHRKANKELIQLAKKKKLRIPTEIDPERLGMFDRLRGLSGEDFRREYMKAVMKDHQRSISIFRQEAKEGGDEDFRGFAEKTLPMLQEHLKTAKSITR